MVRLTVDWWALEIRLELSWLRSYREVMERHLATLAANPPENLRDDLASDDEDVWRPAQDEWAALSQEVAPRMARGSFVVALYAAYESAVTELAADVGTRVGALLRLSDLGKPTFLQQAKKYFDRVLGIPLCPDADQWSVITELSLIRHVFAHANGRLVTLNKRALNMIEAMERRTDASESFGSILLSEEYVQRLAESVEASVTDLIERSKTPRLASGNLMTIDNVAQVQTEGPG